MFELTMLFVNVLLLESCMAMPSRPLEFAVLLDIVLPLESHMAIPPKLFEPAVLFVRVL